MRELYELSFSTKGTGITYSARAEAVQMARILGAGIIRWVIPAQGRPQHAGYLAV